MAKAFAGPGVLGGVKGKQALLECFYKPCLCLYAAGYWKSTVYQERMVGNGLGGRGKLFSFHCCSVILLLYKFFVPQEAQLPQGPAELK